MKFLCYSFLFFFSGLCYGASISSSPVGSWSTIDDETGQKKSVVEITETNGTLTGKIIQLFKKPEEDQNPKCDKCSGEKKDQPIIGMTILWELKKTGEEKWGEGKILDPKNGKVYSCKVELIDGGKKIKVRGFIGFSILGRSQIWERL